MYVALLHCEITNKDAVQQAVIQHESLFKVFNLLDQFKYWIEESTSITFNKHHNLGFFLFA